MHPADKKILKDAITRYHKAIKSRKAAWLKFRSTYNYEQAMISFDHYSAGFNGIYQSNQMDILKALMKIFKNSSRTDSK